MLPLLNILFHALHLFVIFFNLFGWIPKKTRKFHRWCIGLTALFWLVVGPVFYQTPGYCPLTDWHWQVKTALGHENLPYSYIDYLFQLIGIELPAKTVDLITALAFAAALLATLAVCFYERRNDKKG